MTPKDRHNSDQGLAEVAETFPPFWFRLYSNCLASGFTADQSMQLLLTVVKAAFSQTRISGEDPGK